MRGPLSHAERAFAAVAGAPVHERLPAAFQRTVLADAFRTLVLGAVTLPARLGAAVASAPLDPADTRSILVIRLDHLGDLILTTPVLAALRAWAPGASITILCRGANADLARRLPFVDEVMTADVPWILPGTGSLSNLRACLALARSLRARRWDLAVDLRWHNRLDGMLVSLSGARSRLGFDTGGGGFGLTHRCPGPGPGHEAARMADAIRRFGIPVADQAAVFPLSPDDRAAAAKLVPRGAFVAIHTGAGNAVKRWMPGRFAWVGRELARRARVRVAVLAGPGEEETGEPLVRALPKSARIDLRGRLGLFEMGAVIGRAALFVGNDGGAGHVAAAVGTPSVIVFSGTNEAEEWAPPGRRVRVVERRVPCKPCGRTDCPFDQACLRSVTVDAVLNAALETLRKV